MIQQTHQISFHFFDVGGRDAIYIRFLGSDSYWHNILVDGGYGKEYKNAFGPLIKDLISNNEKIDNWIISHVDRDHIGAVLGFVRDIKILDKHEVVKNFLFNHSPEVIQASNGKISVGDGIKFRDYLSEKNLLSTVPINTKTIPVECSGFKMTFLSPTPEKEAAAKELWRVEETSGKIGRPEDKSDHKKTIEELKTAKFIEDTDPINGSSISLLAEFGDLKALLLADSHPSDVIDSLSALGYCKKKPIEVEFMQLSHHGSKANTSSELLEIVNTKCYVVTGNGIHNRHPDKEAIVRLLTKDKRSSEILNIHFACDTKDLRNIFDVDVNACDNHKFECSYAELGPESKTLAYLPLKDNV
ncbi:MBL fold metallo-hydrolase [Chryseobacterium sp. Y16C]|uniref:ComEC/Rec2 family competence protein n=1 Tax=Chryseobacterium sp. Y16C TaxID=2920939 RepID=UPI001F0A4DE4|nr:MBL fold metallo-hydrolase [Chryseobacterium sp. Y16C]MCT4319212.1 MBL fold metallo-hydrolase [Elizabethkingia anophelis]UMQ40593.1 MBL fold metallo-hydrolase [Chryseobacterium sp. Y16C]